MTDEKQNLKKYFDEDLSGLIIHTLYSYKGIEFFINLTDLDEVVLRKDIVFFKDSFRKNLETFLTLSDKIFRRLPDYFSSLKQAFFDSDEFIRRKINEQSEKIIDLRKTLDRTNKYLASWVEESEKYYADRLKKFTFNDEKTGSVTASVDSISGKFFFNNPLKVQTAFPPNINKLNDVSSFLEEVWKTHYDYFFSETGTELDTEISAISEVERIYIQLK